MAANTTLLIALGVADTAKPAAGAAQALDTQASTGDIAKVTVAAGATHQLVTQTLGTRIQLSEANKTSFANGALAVAGAPARVAWMPPVVRPMRQRNCARKSKLWLRLPMRTRLRWRPK